MGPVGERHFFEERKTATQPLLAGLTRSHVHSSYMSDAHQAAPASASSSDQTTVPLLIVAALGALLFYAVPAAHAESHTHPHGHDEETAHDALGDDGGDFAAPDDMAADDAEATQDAATAREALDSPSDEDIDEAAADAQFLQPPMDVPRNLNNETPAPPAPEPPKPPAPVPPRPPAPVPTSPRVPKPQPLPPQPAPSRQIAQENTGSEGSTRLSPNGSNGDGAPAPSTAPGAPQ